MFTSRRSLHLLVISLALSTAMLSSQSDEEKTLIKYGKYVLHGTALYTSLQILSQSGSPLKLLIRVPSAFVLFVIGVKPFINTNYFDEVDAGKREDIFSLSNLTRESSTLAKTYDQAKRIVGNLIKNAQTTDQTSKEKPKDA